MVKSGRWLSLDELVAPARSSLAAPESPSADHQDAGRGHDQDGDRSQVHQSGRMQAELRGCHAAISAGTLNTR
jgi:hypothetical protein